jgi:hypothetical protein
MNSFECFQQYLAIKNHFTKPSYDYFRYGGKTNAKVASFEKRKDKLWFQKLAKHPDVVNFLVANLSQNEKLWIRDLAYSDEAEKTYTTWLKRNQSLTYMFQKDLDKLDPVFNDNFMCHSNSHPTLLKLFLAGDVSLETLCILLNITGAHKHWDKELEYDLVWESLKVKYAKYTPFIQYDKNKFKKIILEFYSGEE